MMSAVLVQAKQTEELQCDTERRFEESTEIGQGLNVFTPPNSYGDILSSGATVFGDGAFGR